MLLVHKNNNIHDPTSKRSLENKAIFEMLYIFK